MKILAAEDEKNISLIYKIFLEERGHDVTITADGKMCLEKYYAAATKTTSHLPVFDVVVLDYRMPGLDGLDVAKEILRLRPDQRIIFASAYTEETLCESIRDLKMFVELLQKPFEPSVLVEIIEGNMVYEQMKAAAKDRKKLDDWNLSHDEAQDLLDKVTKLRRAEVEMRNKC
jgi:two-component system cell cycle response regulator CpdR